MPAAHVSIRVMSIEVMGEALRLPGTEHYVGGDAMQIGATALSSSVEQATSTPHDPKPQYEHAQGTLFRTVKHGETLADVSYYIV